MGTSTITLEQVLDTLAAKGIPDPRQKPSGYGDRMAIDLATQVMADIVCERFNWKWNRQNATPFLTNSWQQDYPQLAQPNGIIGWGEDGDAINILNTALPKPLKNLTWRRGLSRTSQLNGWWPNQICWMYNQDLYIGEWPGAHVTYYPLGVSPQGQNPLMSMTDANGNILIVTTPGPTSTLPGVTGSVAPVLPANSAEGTTVVDGTVTWTCVSPTSQGFRLDKLPPATGPTLLIKPYYQVDPVLFTKYGQTLAPMPDSFSRFFYRGLESELMIAMSVNDAAALKRGQYAKANWMLALQAAMKQGDREMNIYGLVPARPVVEPRWSEWRPYTADDPY